VHLGITHPGDRMVQSVARCKRPCVAEGARRAAWPGGAARVRCGGQRRTRFVGKRIYRHMVESANRACVRAGYIFCSRRRHRHKEDCGKVLNVVLVGWEKEESEQKEKAVQEAV